MGDDYGVTLIPEELASTRPLSSFYASEILHPHSTVSCIRGKRGTGPYKQTEQRSVYTHLTFTYMIYLFCALHVIWEGRRPHRGRSHVPLLSMGASDSDIQFATVLASTPRLLEILR